jgi:hypothetical protein
MQRASEATTINGIIDLTVIDWEPAMLGVLLAIRLNK